MSEPHLTENEERQFELEIRWSAILLAREHRREIKIQCGLDYECDCQVCRTVWKVLEATQGDPMNPQPPKEQTLSHQCGVKTSGEPFVQLLLEDKIIAQMSSSQAREHSQRILEAAESAEQDAFLLRFAQEQLRLALPEAAQLLIEFRKQRAASTGKSQGPTSLDQWVGQEGPKQ